MEDLCMKPKENDELKELDLSVRSYNALKGAGYASVEQLSCLTKEEILGMRNMGRKSAEEVVSKLEDMGYEIEEHKITYLESDDLDYEIIEYNLVRVVGFLEDVFETSVSLNYEADKREEFLKRFNNFLSTLKERDKKILIERYGLINGKPETLEKTAFNFELTRERIRQIEKKAKRKLKDIRRSKTIRQYIKLQKNINEGEMSDFILKCVINNEDE
jgi:RNA polymerase sigma factor (sigma-70 family)